MKAATRWRAASYFSVARFGELVDAAVDVGVEVAVVVIERGDHRGRLLGAGGAVEVDERPGVGGRAGQEREVVPDRGVQSAGGGERGGGHDVSPRDVMGCRSGAVVPGRVPSGDLAVRRMTDESRISLSTQTPPGASQFSGGCEETRCIWPRGFVSRSLGKRARTGVLWQNCLVATDALPRTALDRSPRRPAIQGAASSAIRRSRSVMPGTILMSSLSATG